MDALIGDPAWLPHIVVKFGWLISTAERWFNKGAHRKLKGALSALFLIGCTYVLLVVHPILLRSEPMAGRGCIGHIHILFPGRKDSD